jgi:tetratricopeptide (TPR) repeat protein
MSVVVGQILGGHYQIISALSHGGFGATFLAEDQYLPNKPRCVVKQLKPQANDPQTLEIARRLFDTEARVLHPLGNHDQIPRLLAYFEENQEFYLVQELIEGHDLSQELQPGVQWSEAQAIALLQDVLQILEFVHQQQVIHRDVNPHNLIRRQQDQKLVLIDFGAVKQISTTLLQPGQAPRTVAIGTPGYLPIEQATGNPQPTSDLYALGMVAIQALTGLSPQDLPKDPNTGDLLWHSSATVSPELQTILDKMVRYDFRDRYQSATQVLNALKDLKTAPAATVAIAPKLRSPLRTQLPKLGSWRKPALLGGVVVIIGAIAAVFGVRYFNFSSATELYRKGETLAALQRYPEALAAFDKAVQIRQDYPEAWNGRAQVLTQLKQYPKALDAYDRAIQIDPQSWESWSDRGLLLNTWQRHSEALQSFNQAIALNPNAPEAWNGKGQALIGAKRYEEAIAAFKQAVTLQPDSAAAWYGQGWALHNLQKYDEAVKAYDKAVELKSDYHQAWYNRGNSLSSLQKYQDAIASYDKAVQFQPRFYQAWYSRGNMQSNLQQYEAALESYEQVTKLQPSYYPAFYSRAWTLHRLQRYEEAIAAYDKALDLNPNDYLAWYNRGNALYNLKRYDKAIASYDQALQIQPDHSESWYSLGNALTNTKRYPDALAAYDKALQYKSDYREANEARDRLKRQLEAQVREQKPEEPKVEGDRVSEEQEPEPPVEEQNSDEQKVEGDRSL